MVTVVAVGVHGAMLKLELHAEELRAPVIMIALVTVVVVVVVLDYGALHAMHCAGQVRSLQ